MATLYGFVRACEHTGRQWLAESVFSFHCVLCGSQGLNSVQQAKCLYWLSYLSGPSLQFYSKTNMKQKGQGACPNRPSHTLRHATPLAEWWQYLEPSNYPFHLPHPPPHLASAHCWHCWSSIQTLKTSAGCPLAVLVTLPAVNLLWPRPVSRQLNQEMWAQCWKACFTETKSE